jgi:CMP-N,N'-diacetyllegionaminic acid synthase
MTPTEPQTSGSQPRILAVVLARGGSKSVPRKNVKLLAGLPMIVYTLHEGLKSKRITHLVVSTDDAEIAEISKAHGALVPFMRPAELASDTASSKDCLQHAVCFMEEREKYRYDYVIELMVTNPLKTVEDIDAVLEKLVRTGADSVISVMQLMDHHPARIKKIVDDRIVDFCVPEIPDSRRQDLKPDAFIRNGSIYAMRRDVLMIQNARYGTADSRPYVMPESRCVNVDSPIDFLTAEAMMIMQSGGSGR